MPPLVSASTAVVPADPLSPASSTSLVMKTPENTEDLDPEPKDGGIHMEYSSN